MVINSDANDCMVFMHLQPHAQMPDDDTTSDLLDRIMYIMQIM